MTTDRRRVVVVGLGTMGMPMATRLLQRGHQVTVVPHSSKASAQWLASQGALIADSPAAAVTMGADVVLLSLPSSESVAEVLNGPHGVFSARRGQLVIVDTSTIGPRAAQDMADRASAVDAHYLDCPISGGPSRAQTGTLTAIVGGDEHVIASTRDVVDCLASNVFVVGGVGAAQVALGVADVLAGFTDVLARFVARGLGKGHRADTHGGDGDAAKESSGFHVVAPWL